MMNINGRTQLIGLIGWPIAHSFSPAMHNAAAAALGLNWAYLPLSVPPAAVAAAVRGLPALGFRGVNVTVPHKQAVIPLLDEVAAGARAIGAVNTIVVDPEDGRLSGTNTDWSGFLADLQGRGVAVAGRHCLVLGAGGSARAVAYALATAGAQVTVLARRPEQGQQLATDLQPFVPLHVLHTRPWSQLASLVATSQAPLIVNTTPLGMAPHVNTSPWPDNCPWPADAFLYDLVYNPIETQLMRQAQVAGCAAVNGLEMLVQQGAQAFALWTGQMPDVAVMRAAIGKQRA
jgi:shikimate dehydrogenase